MIVENRHATNQRLSRVKCWANKVRIFLKLGGGLIPIRDSKFLYFFRLNVSKPWEKWRKRNSFISFELTVTNMTFSTKRSKHRYDRLYMHFINRRVQPRYANESLTGYRQKWCSRTLRDEGFTTRIRHPEVSWIYNKSIICRHNKNTSAFLSSKNCCLFYMSFQNRKCFFPGNKFHYSIQ